MRKNSKINLKKAIFGCFFSIIAMFGLVQNFVAPVSVYAEPEETIVTEEITEENAEKSEEEATTEETEETEEAAETTKENSEEEGLSEGSCEKNLEGIGWLVCPSTGVLSKAVDWMYNMIRSVLAINPIEAGDGQPIYEVWKYFRGLTNIVFIIFLLVVIYSQITGLGINNYGIKKALPKLIVSAILVNLSFIICSIAVDVSNVLGNGLRGVFETIEASAMSGMSVSSAADISLEGLFGGLAAGVAIGAAVIVMDPGSIFMLAPIVLGAVIAVGTGLLTIAMRQAVVAVLVMIAPLAVVANILPNTESLFVKWRKMLTQMLVFYPTFSVLFGASHLAGLAIISSATNGFILILGVAVQIFPLFFSWSLMRMSGTLLEKANIAMRNMANKPQRAVQSWAESRRNLMNAKQLAKKNPYTPSAKLMQFMSDRRIAREEEMKELNELAKNRGLAYAARRNVNKKTGVTSREGEEAYERTIRNLGYMREIEKNKNDLNKGLTMLAANANATKAQTARFEKLDAAIVKNSDALKIEQARGELIEFRNAEDFHRRMEDAVNAHFDDKNVKDEKYRRHYIKDRNGARARYNTAESIMEGNAADIQYAAANSAQAYDTQRKIVDAKMQKYFELLPPTKDVDVRLSELTENPKSTEYIDSIVAGLRVLNQRGDTDIVQKQINNIMDKNIGGGLTLGTHASQALASFLMFEVKDSDPVLRRFGKYINLETARVYNENERQVTNVTYDEYVRGYHDGEPGGRMYAKKGMQQLIEGTSLDNIERTALSNLDESLKKAYGFGTENWDINGYLKKREDVQTALEPAFLSASLKWMSGSEQMASAVKFWTGYGLKQRTDENGNVILNDENEPIYDMKAVWDDFNDEDKKIVKDYYSKKTKDYIKDQTVGQILGLRTDYRGPILEHFLDMYLDDESDGVSSEKKRAEFEAKCNKIKSKRYKDKTPDEEKALREKELYDYKASLASAKIRKVLDETGKLEQIYRTRRSGAANNAKDWWRKWIGLDDENAVRVYLDKKDLAANKKNKKTNGTRPSPSGNTGTVSNGFTDSDRAFFSTKVREIYDDYRGYGSDRIYEESVDWINKNLGGLGGYILKKFNSYYKNHPHVDSYDLMEYLQSLLQDPDNY